MSSPAPCDACRIGLSMPLVIPGYRTKALGRAAEFCPMCRGIRAFRVREVNRIHYLLLVIPIPASDPTVWLMTCEDCGFYQLFHSHLCSPTKKPIDRIDELLRETNQRLWERIAPRITLEAQLRAGRLAAAERESLLLEPFVAAENMRAAHKIARWPQVSKTAAALALMGITAGIVLAMQDEATYYKLRPTVLLATSGAIIVLAAALGPFMWGNVNRDLMCLLVRALRPLDIQREELTAIIARLRANQIPLVRRLNARKLEASLVQAR